MNMPAVRCRTASLVAAMAVVAAGCAFAGSDDVLEPTPSVTVDVPRTSAEASTIPGVVEPVSDTAADTSPDTVTADDKDVVTRSADASGDGVLPQGFGSVTARVTSVDGDVCEVCLWLADDDPSRRRGLMGVTDLGDAVGMVFRYDAATTSNFFMFQTPSPLSIAWFDEAGSHVGQADMEPCMVVDSAVCERYMADAPYVLAVEMFGGQLDAIGIGPGASIELFDLPCASIPG